MNRVCSLALALFLSAALAGISRGDMPEIDYVRRVMLPEGHSMGLQFAAEATAPAYFSTRTQLYALDLTTGTFSAPHTFPLQFVSTARVTYAAGDSEYMTYANPSSFVRYDLSFESLNFFGSQSAAMRSLFYQSSSDTYFGTTVSGLYELTLLTNSVQSTPVHTYTSFEGVGSQSLYVQDDIATTLFGNGLVQRIDLTTGLLLNSFTVAGSIANSLTLDANNNIYVGNNLGGAYVYDITGQLLTSFLPGANNPTDPNLGTNASWMFLNDDDDLLVMDDTGLHQFKLAAVPEPSTAVWGALCASIGLLSRRRKCAASRQA